MKIRFYNARILTMEDPLEVIWGEVWICDDRIVHAGPVEEYVQESKRAKSARWDREIDAEGNLMMPGFKNAHTHSGMTFLRSYADDLPLLEWLNQKVFPMEALITGDDIYLLSKLAIMEYLTSGITSNFDMYLTPDTISKAAEDCGYRTVICGAVNDFTQSVEELGDWYQKYNQPGKLVSFMLGFHAEYTTSREILEGIADLAVRFKAPVYAHNSESAGEVAQCLELNGRTPTAYLDSLGLFAYGGGGFHCVHMTQEDLEIFRDRRLSAITNPSSNLKLASGIAPIKAMMDMGVNIAIGTDGPASNNCLDMFREMFLTTALAKLREQDASAVDAGKVLRMATAGGARAMGLTDCDVLAPGKKADIIMVDLHQPNMQPIHDIGKNIVYSGSKQNVKMTMVDGKILYEDGKFHIGQDPEEIYFRANEIVSKTTGSFSEMTRSKRLK
ncbi:MAG: amidohydrolase [Lachnospiraceae bacterium]|jgi:5-methylthioadenosine/S-adenosylhomocysteine deaminase|nr:amidohydrolase [Lachnospiraceae bacterium]